MDGVTGGQTSILRAAAASAVAAASPGTPGGLCGAGHADAFETAAKFRAAAAATAAAAVAAMPQWQ